MEVFFDPAILAGLATLIVLEVVLGIDNLVFIAILADKLPPHQRDRARLLGLGLALVMRLALLASIAWIVGLTRPLFSLGGFAFSWRDLILLGGGLFLLAKATKEIHERLEGEAHHGGGGRATASFVAVIVQILAIDAVFSLDSIITAVGMVDELWVMMTAVIVAMAIMIAASKPLTTFVGRHPTVIILCLSFLLLIGVSLIAEGFHFHMPKGYLYAAIGFSILIELFNQVAGRNRRRALAAVPLRDRTADAILRLMTPSSAEPAQLSETSDLTPSDAIDAGEAFEPAEREMMRGVITLADRPVRSLMTPRDEVFWLDIGAPAAVNARRLVEAGRTRALVCRGSLDQLLGVVESKAVLPLLLDGSPVDLGQHLRQPLVVSEDITALRLVEHFRSSGEFFAVVVDDAGVIDGVVTTTDLFAAIAGDLADDEDAPVRAGEDGILHVDGSATLDEVHRALGREAPADRRFATVTGALMAWFGHLPQSGETADLDGLRFTILETSASRIERVEVRLTPEADQASAAE